ncbi:MAG: glycerophosphodiester phosphodiesterase [Myxococcales bacterium]|nr:glycerophosphodiester phosphodiesterase [Myxococcales bacterium]MCB9524312.1 glycerophosphodiester phosphodiesterase [Myxococcales bacterium]
MPAFARALAEGADGIELDVRASVDGEALVIHDADLARVGGGALAVERTPWRKTTARRLQGGAHVPRLREVLDQVAGRIPVNVELKTVGVALPVARALRPGDRIVVSSFLDEALAAFRGAAPGVDRALLTERTPGEAPPWARLHALGCRAWHAHHPTLTGSEVRAAAARGLTVRAYTVAHAGDARRLAAMGVAGVFVDEPGALRQRL